MTRTLTALLAVLLMLPAAAAAKARSTFTIRGAGFGHGVGMSQYGALGYAQHGWSAAQILAHYYSGTALGTTDPSQPVRVLLATGTSARFTGASQAGARALDPAKTYVATRTAAGQVQLRTGSRKVATFTAPLQVAGADGTVQLAGKGTYRGMLEITPGAFKGITVVNAVALDDYVQGVVPAESPAYWPLEALKAQAIAARTYAITSARGGTFDQYDDTRSQVYRGVSAETPASNEAVTETRGQVVTYQGRPVTTYFFSTSGGRTENVENSFPGAQPEPWLRSVDDPYDSVSPLHRWKPLQTSLGHVGRELGGLVRGRFRGIVVTQRGASPRIVSANVVGTGGVTSVSGATLRARLGLRDTWAYFTTIISQPVSARSRPAALPQPQAADPSGGALARAAISAARSSRRQLLGGFVIPARRGGKLRVQVRSGGVWRTVGTTRVRSGGAYAYRVTRSGTYRVLYYGGTGPAIAIR
jgi:stage II sporulation protein D